MKNTPIFDLSEELGLDKTSPNFKETEYKLNLQMLLFILSRLVADFPATEERIEQYKNEFVSGVKNE